MNHKYRLFNLFIAVVLVLTTLSFPTASAQAQTESEGELLLKPTSIGFPGSSCLQVGNSVSDTQSGVGASLQTCSYDNTIFQAAANQTFSLVYQGTTSAGLLFRVKVKHSGLCLWPLNNATANGTAIVQQTCSASKTWYVAHSLNSPNDDGDLDFRGINNGKCMHITNAGVLVLNSCNGDAFKAIPIGIGVRVKSDYGGRCLDVNNSGGGLQNGAKIQGWDCLGYNQTNQRWNIYADTSSRKIKLIALHSAKCAKQTGVTSSSDPDLGDPIKQYSCTGADTEWWKTKIVGISPAGILFALDVFSSSPFNWGRCMDLDTAGSGAGLQNGAEIQGWWCNGPTQTNQNWIFRKIAP